MKILTNILWGLLILCVITIWIAKFQIRNLRADRDTYRRNTAVLLDSVERYRTSEGLNAATVGQLELKLSEFRKYRADDAALIETLRADIKDLERVTTTGTKTVTPIQTVVKDSVVCRDSLVIDTLRCIDYRSPWLDIEGCIDAENRFTGTIENRDSLLIADHGPRARFLGFLWKTRRIKNHQLEVVSRNPNTTIESVEFITIRK